MRAKIGTYAALALLRTVSLFPFPVIYFLSDILGFFLARIVRYRRKVVEINLRNAFPEKSEKERKKIARNFYRHLSDITFETIKTRTMSSDEMSRRMVIRNPDLPDSYFDRRQSVIVMALHYGNWEWLLHMPLQIRHHHFFVYKPLHDLHLDLYLNRIRERFGGETVPMSLTLRKMMEAEKKGDPVLTWLAADQAPPWNHPFWTTFLNQPTLFFNGPAKLARRFGHPVLFQQVRRIKRGYYETWFEILSENPELATEDVLINTYVRNTERVIREEPSSYLWSHKRWKYRKPGDKPAY